MKILKEAKENLPGVFITSFVSDGWDKVGLLKEQLEAIKREFKNTAKIEELIQGLIDAYLVCIGQMEQHLVDKDYIEFPGGSKEIKEALSEDVNINIENVTVNDPEVKVEATHEDEEVRQEEVTNLATDPNPELLPVEPVEPTELDKLEKVKDTVKKDDIEPFEYFTDFPEPTKDEDED